MYQIKTDNSTGVTNLVGYKLNKKEDMVAPSFSVDTFTTSGKPTWKVSYISENGNCVVILQDSTLNAY